MNSIEFHTIDPGSLKELVREFRNKKPMFDNYYNFEHTGFEYFSSGNSLLIRKKHNGFYRLYIISGNEKDISSILINVEKDHAVNIPSKTPIENWNELLTRNGFVCRGEYIRWIFTDLRKGETQIKYAGNQHYEQIYNLIYSTFDKITDTLPDRHELLDRISNNEVIINEVGDKITGCLIYSIEKNVFHSRVWLDTNGTGISLFLNAFSIVEKKGLSKIYAWTNINNDFSNKIHELLGGRRDGLKDFTFIKPETNEPKNN